MIRTRKETHTHTHNQKRVFPESPTDATASSQCVARSRQKRAHSGAHCRQGRSQTGTLRTHASADPLGDLMWNACIRRSLGGSDCGADASAELWGVLRCVFCFCIGLLCSVFSCFWVRLLLYLFSDFGFLLMCIKLLLLLLLQNHYTNIRTQKIHRARCTPSVNAVARGLPTMRCSR